MNSYINPFRVNFDLRSKTVLLITTHEFKNKNIVYSSSFFPSTVFIVANID